MKRAFVVVDLGFGDCGKGLLTDYLVRRHEASLVVRYNGGAQAGHNVVTEDGRHHTFAQLGAGSFVPGVRTFLSRHVVIHPAALLVESAALEQKGVSRPMERVFISDSARVITPFHQSANRLRELSRGDFRHGSCGVGVGETVADSIAHPDETVRAGDLRSRSEVAKKLHRIRDRKREELRALTSLPDREWQVFTNDELVDAWIDQVQPVVSSIVSDDWLDRSADENVVFEGAQGVLLDERFGFHPYTTWSNCTADNARELAGSQVEVIGVLRAHAVRHGPGPFPSERPELRFKEHNALNDWQGAVRYGLFDAVLARYALDVCRVDRLAITHLDQAPSAHVSSYEGGVHRLDLPGTFQAQEQLAQRLARVKPVVRPHEDPIAAVEELLDRRVDLTGSGPTARNVTER
ncbi:MAG: adenylosuccinate synthetase [Myxococcaceae bacterium]